MKYITLFLLLGVLFSSCTDELAETREDNERAIVNYLEEHNLEAIKTESGLHYIITKEGNGKHPSLRNQVKTRYKGYNIKDQVFEEPRDPISFPLSGVIKGWQEGIPFLSEGGKGTLFIPSHLAYGNRHPSSNQPIIFDVELISFQ